MFFLYHDFPPSPFYTLHYYITENAVCQCPFELFFVKNSSFFPFFSVDFTKSRFFAKITPIFTLIAQTKRRKRRRSDFPPAAAGCNKERLENTCAADILQRPQAAFEIAGQVRRPNPSLQEKMPTFTFLCHISRFYPYFHTAFTFFYKKNFTNRKKMLAFSQKMC